MKLKPVTLPPGRARLATSPDLTGSATRITTIGKVTVAFLAASAAGVLIATITSTLSRTSSSANPASSSLRPAALRNSMSMLVPSTCPSSRSRSRNVSSSPGCRSCASTPMRWGGSSFSAAEPSGHAAAAPPRSAMKLRRLMQNCPSGPKPTKGQRSASQQNRSPMSQMGQNLPPLRQRPHVSFRRVRTCRSVGSGQQCAMRRQTLRRCIRAWETQRRNGDAKPSVESEYCFNGARCSARSQSWWAAP